ncbi:MAG: uL15 family ribosomal protein [Thermoplasmata archaeon]
MGRTRKMRGKRTHGRGQKAGRGKGKRGGSGQAGLLKHKWKWVVKYDPDHFGQYGFKRHAATPPARRAINLEALEHALDGFVERGVAKKEGKGYRVDLSAAGYAKLLGRGSVGVPLTVVVPTATAKAVEKVEAAGGQVVPDVEEE